MPKLLNRNTDNVMSGRNPWLPQPGMHNLSPRRISDIKYVHPFYLRKWFSGPRCMPVIPFYHLTAGYNW